MGSQSWVQPVSLVGRMVRLDPMSVDDAEALFAVGDEELFRYIPHRAAEWSAEAFRRYLVELMAIPDRVMLTARLTATGEAIGSSGFLEIRPEHRGLEIGHTWIARAHQGGAANPEMKLLMLRHAFETLGAIRVQLRTDARNTHSQRAIEKLGALREGVLRKHIVMPDGYVRDTVVYSITDAEWPTVKAGLVKRLGYDL